MRSDAVRRLIAVTAGALRVWLRAFRHRSRKALDDLDREIQKVHRRVSADCSRAEDDRLDVDALRSTRELRILIDLYLRGWTLQEIEDKLDSTIMSGSRIDF